MDTPIYHWPIYLCKGSHKRSHSLGEKEIVRSIPSPAPEQPFRDRSNTLNEKPALPIIRDKYKDLTGEVEVSHSLSLFSLVHTFSLSTQKVLLVEYSLRFLSEQSSHSVSSLSLFSHCLSSKHSWQESERYAYEWQRCLESALQVTYISTHTFIKSLAYTLKLYQSIESLRRVGSWSHDTNTTIKVWSDQIRTSASHCKTYCRSLIQQLLVVQQGHCYSFHSHKRFI